MKFSNTNSMDGHTNIFMVTFEDTEWHAKSFPELRRFQDVVLSRLANIIVGWLFKHHKDEFIKPIMENVIEKVSREVSRDILSRLGLPLESGPTDKTSQTS